MEKTLGQIAFETQFHPSEWENVSDFLKAGWEAQSIAVRDVTIDQCNKIVQLARAGEIDNDFRSISHRILDLKREWHDEDGKY